MVGELCGGAGAKRMDIIIAIDKAWIKPIAAKQTPQQKILNRGANKYHLQKGLSSMVRDVVPNELSKHWNIETGGGNWRMQFVPDNPTKPINLRYRGLTLHWNYFLKWKQNTPIGSIMVRRYDDLNGLFMYLITGVKLVLV